ncbi:hypothetical protein J1605_015906 [Eschrichtius robustus]|uniref:Uncharacterized protein n=1 Tax=Eschrichtius robustus TaxID=9764 RepID=A0AB34GA83_ESCRO|nr:hypothetical protein J1605_015906 [Eschrichtius robustus]
MLVWVFPDPAPWLPGQPVCPALPGSCVPRAGRSRDRPTGQGGAVTAGPDAGARGTRGEPAPARVLKPRCAPGGGAPWACPGPRPAGPRSWEAVADSGRDFGFGQMSPNPRHQLVSLAPNQRAALAGSPGRHPELP